MTRQSRLAILCFCFIFIASLPAASFDVTRLVNHSSRINAESTTSFEPAFSPSPQAEATILRFIGEAQQSIHLAAYSFTSKEIALALINAARRRVDVRVVVDKSNIGNAARYTAATFLANQGIPVRVDSMYAIQHQKVIIVDGISIQTGSYNYTVAARDRNSEDVLVIRNAPKLAAQFEQNWLKMWTESQPLTPRY